MNSWAGALKCEGQLSHQHVSRHNTEGEKARVVCKRAGQEIFEGPFGSESASQELKGGGGRGERRYPALADPDLFSHPMSVMQHTL